MTATTTTTTTKETNVRNVRNSSSGSSSSSSSSDSNSIAQSAIAMGPVIDDDDDEPGLTSPLIYETACVAIVVGVHVHLPWCMCLRVAR